MGRRRLVESSLSGRHRFCPPRASAPSDAVPRSSDAVPQVAVVPSPSDRIDTSRLRNGVIVRLLCRGYPSGTNDGEHPGTYIRLSLFDDCRRPRWREHPDGGPRQAAETAVGSPPYPVFSSQINPYRGSGIAELDHIGIEGPVEDGELVGVVSFSDVVVLLGMELQHCHRDSKCTPAYERSACDLLTPAGLPQKRLTRSSSRSRCSSASRWE